jgi:hypothetical protein
MPDDDDEYCDDSMFRDLAGDITWPKVTAIAILCATTIAVCAICGWAPGWDQ